MNESVQWERPALRRLEAAGQAMLGEDFVPDEGLEGGS